MKFFFTMERRGEDYFVCRVCHEWTENEDDMVLHISRNHDVEAVKDGISTTFIKLLKQVDRTYSDIELCLESLVDNQALIKIRNRLLVPSMERILRVIEEEQEKIIHVVATELDYSV